MPDTPRPIREALEDLERRYSGPIPAQARRDAQFPGPSYDRWSLEDIEAVVKWTEERLAREQQKREEIHRLSLHDETRNHYRTGQVFNAQYRCQAALNLRNAWRDYYQRRLGHAPAEVGE